MYLMYLSLIFKQHVNSQFHVVLALVQDKADLVFIPMGHLDDLLDLLFDVRVVRLGSYHFTTADLLLIGAFT